MANKKEQGFAGEQIAEKFLKGNGYKILGKNYSTKAGEIDIIARKNKILVFVEVKTRSSDQFGVPAESVNQKKLARLAIVAQQYIQKKHLEKTPFIFEIVSVTKTNNDYSCEIIPVG